MQLDPAYASAYNGKGNVLYDRGRYKEALACYEQALRCDSDYTDAYNGKGDALYDLRRYREAFAAYDQAIRLDASYADAYNGRGNLLYDLKRYQEHWPLTMRPFASMPPTISIIRNRAKVLRKL